MLTPPLEISHRRREFYAKPIVLKKNSPPKIRIKMRYHIFGAVQPKVASSTDAPRGEGGEEGVLKVRRYKPNRTEEVSASVS